MKVGLTGGIGCGKSTVVAFFREAGWQTIQTDVMVRDLLGGDNEVQSALRRRWGAKIFAEDGRVDRRKIAERVFSDEAELQWLESLLHPMVRKLWQGELAAAPEANWLVEIPLLFEKRLETAFDLSVCVTSPVDVVEMRMAARAYTGVDLERRRQRQMPLDEKMRRADCVITNAGSLDFLKKQTQSLIQHISDY